MFNSATKSLGLYRRKSRAAPYRGIFLQFFRGAAFAAPRIIARWINAPEDQGALS
jgi:hypothetical protein